VCQLARDNIGSQHVTGEGSLFDIPPAAIGRFRVLHQVGAGTCGPVFRGDDPTTATPVAIKLLTLNLPPERAADLVEQLAALVTQTPPLTTVVAPLDAGLHEGTPFLVTSFAPGDSLDVALKHFGPAALVDLIPRLRALAAALDAAATRGLVHGALHPRDVLVSETETTLTGLGVWPVLARAGVRLPRRNPYRAPELGDGAVSAAADQFSLGALAYEWMTGRRAPSMFVAGDMAPVPGADRDALANLFAVVLNADPSARFPSCSEFVSALADIDQAVPEDEVPVESRARRRSRTPDLPLLGDDSPLAAFPAEDDGDPLPDDTATGVLTAAPAMPLGGAAEPTPEPDLRLRDTEPQTAEPDLPLVRAAMPSPPPTPLARARDVAVVDLPAPTAPAPRSPVGLAAMLLVGLGLGLVAGYLTWGRPPNAGPEVARPAETTRVAPAPVQAAPAASAGAPPASPATESTVTPAVPTGAPSPAVPSTPAAQAPSSTTARPPETTAVGSLLVRSTPAGATVFVDNQRRGVTPLTVQGLALGTREVRVQRDGFVTEQRRVALSSGRPSRSLDVRLSRPAAPAASAPAARSAPTSAAKTGTLLIESRPSGATVLLNGRPAGTTPVTVDDLAPGSYAVQMQLAGFRPLSTTVRVVAGERTRAGASLTRAQEPE
jgi:hypothetical protein